MKGFEWNARAHMWTTSCGQEMRSRQVSDGDRCIWCAHSGCLCDPADLMWCGLKVEGGEWQSACIYGALPRDAMPGSSQEVHPTVECDGCGMFPVRGSPVPSPITIT